MIFIFYFYEFLVFLINCILLCSDPPEPPVYFRATKVGADFTILEWKPPAQDGGSKITGYTIFKREDWDDEPKKLTTVLGIENYCHVKGLKQNVNYYFSICAENKAGLSKPSDAEYAVCPMRPLGKLIQNILKLFLQLYIFSSHYPLIIYNKMGLFLLQKSLQDLEDLLKPLTSRKIL